MQYGFSGNLPQGQSDAQRPTLCWIHLALPQGHHVRCLESFGDLVWQIFLLIWFVRRRRPRLQVWQMLQISSCLPLHERTLSWQKNPRNPTHCLPPWLCGPGRECSWSDLVWPWSPFCSLWNSWLILGNRVALVVPMMEGADFCRFECWSHWWLAPEGLPWDARWLCWSCCCPLQFKPRAKCQVGELLVPKGISDALYLITEELFNFSWSEQADALINFLINGGLWVVICG